MSGFLKSYTVTLKAISPVFIGSGEKISKKEYLFVPQQSKVIIPDFHRLYMYLDRLGLSAAFEGYMLSSDGDLHMWCGQHGVPPADYAKFAQYSIPCRGDVFDYQRNKNKEIHTFVKDAFKRPYIPGSSLKGALRTVILAGLLAKGAGAGHEQGIINAEFKGRRTCLSEVKALEAAAFNVLNRSDKKGNAVNDVMNALRVSDSLPVDTSCLALCRKIDVSTVGNENALPLVRECIKPNTELKFSLTIDHGLLKKCGFDLTPEGILKAADDFKRIYDNCFLSAFGPVPRTPGGVIYIGGGSGFASKTVVYPLLGKAEGLKFTSRMMRGFFSRHKHERDERLGVSPHMKKCTRYGGAGYEFGLCAIDIAEGETV